MGSTLPRIPVPSTKSPGKMRRTGGPSRFVVQHTRPGRRRRRVLPECLASSLRLRSPRRARVTDPQLLRPFIPAPFLFLSAFLQTGVGIGNKAERALRAKQIRDARRVEILDEKRASRAAPKVVALLALNDKVDLRSFITQFAEAAGVTDPAAVARAVLQNPDRPCTFDVPRHRHRLSLLLTRGDDSLAALEAVKVADTLLVIAPVCCGDEKDKEDGDDDLMDDDNQSTQLTKKTYDASRDLGASAEPSDAVKKTLTVLRAFGFPGTITCALVGLSNVAQKKKAATKIAVTNTVTKALQIPQDRQKSVPFDTRAERLDVVRTVTEQRATNPLWRNQRAYVLAEFAECVPEAAVLVTGPAPAVENLASELVTVCLEGYVRGIALSAEQLVHLPGIGDFPLARVEAATPRLVSVGGDAGVKNDGMEGFGNENRTIAVPSAAGTERPVRENVPDTLAGEQTWPTEEEMAEASSNAPKKPKGWSDYQAAWIPDSGLSSGGESSDDEDGVGDDAAMGDGDNGLDGGTGEFDDADADASESDEEWVDRGDGAGEYGSDVDEETIKNLNEAQRDSVKRSTLASAETEELDFPDETDTPLHVPAKERFARYRGLKSFRSSPWDAKEQLPVEYGRVFAFENYKRAARRAAEAADVQRNALDAVEVGVYVRLVVTGVPKVAAHALLGGVGAYTSTSTAAGCSGIGGAVGGCGVGPAWSGWCGGAGAVVLSSLMQHESKLTVMHYGVTKATSYDAPLRSKTPLWFHVGFRRERCAAIFSTDSLGDKHKFERFLHARRPSMATVYAPVVYGPAPVLGFREEVVFTNGTASIAAQLALSGSVRKADPDRVILKRIILTGVPFKTHKSKAVVRFMFHNPDDIRWFKPLELWTKYGMRGKIRDAIGTHGMMKCLFNGVIQQRDTICATMYKRVYPKFLLA